LLLEEILVVDSVELEGGVDFFPVGLLEANLRAVLFTGDLVTGDWRDLVAGGITGVSEEDVSEDGTVEV
jgi:hypothetical protein